MRDDHSSLLAYSIPLWTRDGRYSINDRTSDSNTFSLYMITNQYAYALPIMLAHKYKRAGGTQHDRSRFVLVEQKREEGMKRGKERRIERDK